MSRRVELFRTNNGGRVYCLPLEVFPGYWGNAYLLVLEEARVLLDVGSGLGNCNEWLEKGIAVVAQEYGEGIGWKDLTHILISHGHIDHFGGLPYIQARSQAQVGVHPLDLPVLTDYENRLERMEGRLAGYLATAGLSQQEQDDLLEMYLLNKSLFKSVPVDFVFEEGEGLFGRMQVHHTPGHCPGQVMFRLDDILLSGDHILADISPHQSPERLSLSAGLQHYLGSLAETLVWADEVSLTLPGHGPPITELGARIRAIAVVHHERLARILELTAEPRSLAQLTAALFPTVQGYHRLLALEETGAHVEFLELRGMIAQVNGHSGGSRVQVRHYQGLDESPSRLDKIFERFDIAPASAAIEGRINVQL